MLNATLQHALNLANQAFQFYLISDICIKDLAYDDIYTPLKDLVCLLQHATQNYTQMVDCEQPFPPLEAPKEPF